MEAVFYLGRRAVLPGQLLSEVAKALALSKECTIVTPEHLTLQTEMLVLNGLNIKGSFNVNVLSAKRLCTRVFDEAGCPERIRIDERGRAIIVRKLLLDLKPKLERYFGAGERRGFASKLIEELICLKQAGITPGMLTEEIPEADHGLKSKLKDIALVYSAYEEELFGRFEDGEDEITEAAARMSNAASIKDASVFVFGYDITTPVMDKLLAALAAVCKLSIFMPLDLNSDINDEYLFMPLKNSYQRLKECIEQTGATITEISVKDNTKSLTAHAHFARELFCRPAAEYKGATRDLRLVMLKNPLDEAMYAAAVIRSYVIKSGCKFSDIRVLCDKPDDYMDAIESAFSAYDVPVFSTGGRSADRHPLGMFLIESLKILAGRGDITALLTTGFTALDLDEAEKLISYAQYCHLKPSELLKPFTRGLPEKIEECEPLRQRLTEPMLALKEKLHAASSVTEQLTGIFEYLMVLECAQKAESMRQRLIELDKRELAAEDAQVWNRIIGTLDQINELCGPKPLGRLALCELIESALAETVVKQLPQTRDAVEITDSGRSALTDVKLIISIGNVSQTGEGGGSLLTQSETKLLSKTTKRFIRTDDIGRLRTQRMYVKDALALARDALVITFPASGQDGAAMGKGTLITEAKRIVPGIRIQGGVEGDILKPEVRFGASGAVKELLGSALENEERGALSAAAALKNTDSAAFNVLKDAAATKTKSELLGAELALSLYGKHDAISVTRLEAFASCPFKFFVKYGLKPQKEQSLSIDTVAEGNFFHSCVQYFVKQEQKRLNQMSQVDAEESMNLISEGVLKETLGVITSDSTTARAEAQRLKSIAAQAAGRIASQLNGSGFEPFKIELEFGNIPGVAAITLTDGRVMRLEGKIDRVDTLKNGNFLRIIDYKRSTKRLDPGEIYAGLQLQLLIYLCAAMRLYHKRSAGVFYLTITDEQFATEETDLEAINIQKEKNSRLNGLLPLDSAALEQMEDKADRVFKVTGRGQNPKLTDKQFQLLIDRTLLNAYLNAEKIYSGNTDIAPLDGKNNKACQYCEYNAVCMRDSHIPGSIKRRTPKFDNFDELLNKLELEEQNKQSI